MYSILDDRQIREHLRELEVKLLDPAIRRDPASVARLLADEFREFGSSGRVFSKDEIIAALGTETPVLFSIDDFRVDIVSPEVALVTYRATRLDDGRVISTSLRSSVWVLRADRWQMLFHQGTRLPQDIGETVRRYTC